MTSQASQKKMELLWVDAFNLSFGNICNTKSANIGKPIPNQRQTKIYERERKPIEVVVASIPNDTFRYKLWRKVYDRSYETNQFCGLQCRILPTTAERENYLAPVLQFICRDLMCYQNSYAFTGKPDRTPKLPFDQEMTDCNFILSAMRLIFKDTRISALYLTGSETETLKHLQVVTRGHFANVSLFDKFVELVRSNDIDIMLALEEISSGSNMSSINPAIRAMIETNSTKPGYLRLRLLDCSRSHNLPVTYDNQKQAYYLQAIVCDAQQLPEVNFITKQVLELPKAIPHMEVQGPARKNTFHFRLRGPTNEQNSAKYFKMEIDVVGALKSKWPDVANEWLQRRRPCGWPSRQFIEEIQSKGCHIVGTSHCHSASPEIEFRFSFSYAEAMLIRSLSFDQRQCFTSFKAIVKHTIEKLETRIGKEIKMKSYHLKNVFLWACETIPKEYWSHQKTWLKCLMFMIDQLLFCLHQKAMPGYFIPYCNLLDPVCPTVLEPLTEAITKVRKDPLSVTIEFLKTTVLYQHICLEKICNPVLYAVSKQQVEIREEYVCRLILQCLQNLILLNTEVSCNFGRTAVFLDMYSNWSKSLTDRIPNSSSKDSVYRDLKLFCVVFLDISYKLHISEHTLKQIAKRESSAEVKSKLGECYYFAYGFDDQVSDALTREEFRIKALLMLHESITGERPVLSDINFASILYEMQEYRSAIQLLESITEERLLAAEMQNALQENPVKRFIKHAIRRPVDERNICGETYLPTRSQFYFLLIQCYIRIEHQDIASLLVLDFETFCFQLHVTKSNLSYYLLGISNDQLQNKPDSKKFFRRSLQFKLEASMHLSNIPQTNTVSVIMDAVLSFGFWCLDIGHTPSDTKHMLNLMSGYYDRMPFSGSRVSRITLHIFAGWIFAPCTHCNKSITPSSNALHALSVPIRFSAMYHIPTPANKLYYVQLMTRLTTGESVLSVLLDVIDSEREIPMSVIIWPKDIRMAVDSHVRELVDNAESCLAVPCIVYAYYLLSTLNVRLGKMEDYQHTMISFESVCQELESTSSVCYSLLGYAYQHAARYNDAVKAHRRSFELHPEIKLYKENIHKAEVLKNTNAPICVSAAAHQAIIERTYVFALKDMCIDWFRQFVVAEQDVFNDLMGLCSHIEYTEDSSQSWLLTE